MTQDGSSKVAAGSSQAPDPSLLTPSTFTLGDALVKAGLPLAEIMVIRHAYVKIHKDGFPGINADSTFDQVLSYTSTQSRDTKVFKAKPARYWVVFLPDLGTRARLWAVVENAGEIPNDGPLREFDLRVLPEALSDLAGRLVIRWASPRAWWVNGTTGQRYPGQSSKSPTRNPSHSLALTTSSSGSIACKPSSVTRAMPPGALRSPP